MSSKNSYYKLIRDKLEKAKAVTALDFQEFDSSHSNDTLSSLQTEDFNKLNSSNDSSFSMKTIKEQYNEWHKFAIQIFFNKCSQVKLRTKKDYLKIINNFIEYSPDLNPEELESFMEHKFKISNKEYGFKAPYSQNQAKYAITIKRFLQSVYSIGKIDVDIKHYTKKTKLEKDQIPIIKHEDILNAYKELSDNGLIQDAMILLTIYTLAIDPYTVWLLTYEGLQDEGYIKYWDHKTRELKSQQISKEFANNFIYFKAYSELKEISSKDLKRQSQDGSNVSGTFIFNISPTNIYNRFKRKFGNKLKWFKFTPLNVIQLSRFKKGMELKDFYPSISQNNN